MSNPIWTSKFRRLTDHTAQTQKPRNVDSRFVFHSETENSGVGRSGQGKLIIDRVRKAAVDFALTVILAESHSGARPEVESRKSADGITSPESLPSEFQRSATFALAV
jgi:hypothetical protein